LPQNPTLPKDVWTTFHRSSKKICFLSLTFSPPSFQIYLPLPAGFFRPVFSSHLFPVHPQSPSPFSVRASGHHLVSCRDGGGQSAWLSVRVFHRLGFLRTFRGSSGMLFAMLSRLWILTLVFRARFGVDLYPIFHFWPSNAHALSLGKVLGL